MSTIVAAHRKLALTASLLLVSIIAIQCGLAVVQPIHAWRAVDILCLAAAAAFFARLAITGARRVAPMESIQGRATRPDPFTPLVRREKFEGIAAERLRGEQKCALLLIDVDDFGRINDQHGYGVADSMLLQLGDRLRRATPAADAVAHIFGDKFGILACGLPSLNDLETLALQLLRACNEPFLCNDISLRISVSIGIAEAPHDGAGTVELMKSANEALRSARARGGATWSVYTPSMRHNNSALSRALPDAIVNRALLPAYSRSQIRPRRRSGGAGALEPSHAWLGFSRCVYPDCRRRRNTE